MGKCLLALGYLLVLAASPAAGVYKRWQPNTNFGNPKNWNSGRAPCGNDTVQIPEESPVVYVQTSTSLKALLLPNDGEIIFGKDATLTFTETPSADCPQYQGDVEYTVSAPRKWVDPANWCSASSETAPCTSPTPALLDSEKVPCAKDNAVFPRDQGVFVDLGAEMSLNVQNVKFSGKTYTTSTFATFINSDDGKRLFPVPPEGKTRSTVTVSRQPCQDPSGCACGNDQGEIFKQICDVYSKRCDRAKCNKPLRPVGSCCDICGAIFIASAGSGFKIDDYRSVLQTFTSAKQTVALIVSKTGANNIQAVITDNTGDDSTAIANAIKSDMDADQQTGGHKYRLTDVQLQVSAGGTVGPIGPGRQTGSGLSGGGIAGIIIVLIVVASLAGVGGLLFYRRKTGKSTGYIDDIRHVLPRGSRIPEDVRSNVNRYGPRDDPGFGNPLYGDLAEVREMDLIPMEAQPTFDARDPDGGFNNPLYDTVKKDGLFGDPTVVGGASATGKTGTDKM